MEISKTQVQEDGFDDNDIPEDFIDPFTYIMMENPMKLPTSGVTMDLGSIK